MNQFVQKLNSGGLVIPVQLDTRYNADTERISVLVSEKQRYEFALTSAEIESLYKQKQAVTFYNSIIGTPAGSTIMRIDDAISGRTGEVVINLDRPYEFEFKMSRTHAEKSERHLKAMLVGKLEVNKRPIKLEDLSAIGVWLTPQVLDVVDSESLTIKASKVIIYRGDNKKTIFEWTRRASDPFAAYGEDNPPPVPLPTKPPPDKTPSLLTQPVIAQALVVDEPRGSFALRVDSPSTIAQTSNMVAGFERKPIPSDMDRIGLDTPLVGEVPPRHHPGNLAPSYPSQALRERAEGKVLVRAEIRPDGRVGQLWIKQSSGSRALDNAAIETVRSWLFHPAQRHGTAVAMWMDVPIEDKVPQTGSYR